MFEDLDRGVVQIMPSRHVHGHDEIIPGARESKVKITKKAKVARPANAFILYRQHHHPLVKSQNPDLHNNQICQFHRADLWSHSNLSLAVILGAQWKKESESTKARFITMAKQLKARHQIEHPDYQYQPRKPSEKKRRMTRRKKAALSEASHSKSSSFRDPISDVGDSVFASNHPTAIVPKIPETVGGNAMLELGDEDLDDQTLSAMLQQYNDTRPHINNQVGNVIVHPSPPVIYDEPTEEAQEQKNFYSNFNTFSSNDSLSAEMEAMMEGKEDRSKMCAALDHFALQARFDEQQDFLLDAEVNRMCYWDEEPIFYQL